MKKSVDLESFGQFFFSLSRDLEAGTSSATTSYHPSQEGDPLVDTSREKELQQPEHQGAMADRPDTVKYQSQGQAPSTQASAPEAPVLQTPLNEERAKKRDIQEETPTGTTTEKQAKERQRLNPYAEEEFTEKTTKNQRGEETIEQRIPPIMETSTNSFQ